MQYEKELEDAIKLADQLNTIFQNMEKRSWEYRTRAVFDHWLLTFLKHEYRWSDIEAICSLEIFLLQIMKIVKDKEALMTKSLLSCIKPFEQEENEKENAMRVAN